MNADKEGTKVYILGIARVHDAAVTVLRIGGRRNALRISARIYALDGCAR
jgi:hypothetical protein